MSHLERWKKTFVLSLLAPPLGYYAERMYQSLPPLSSQCVEKTPQRGVSTELPSLSIIVPARNEAENLQHLLPSLNGLRYEGKLEVIVVDDNSEDETAVIAQQHHARVIRLTELPPGWMGKPHAMCHGAAAARGTWLLFTDADTIHAPNGPADSIRYAVAHNLDGLSLFLEQECRGLSDRLALMAAFAGLFTSWKRNSAYLNGQYVLIRREVYEESGGVTAVRHESLEDVALGHHLQRYGFPGPGCTGDEAVAIGERRQQAELRVFVLRNGQRIGHGRPRVRGRMSV